MGKKVFNKDGSFTNPNRHRVRFYSKIFKKYYSVWIYRSTSLKPPFGIEGCVNLGSYIKCKKPMLMMMDTLEHKRRYGGKLKPLIVPKFDPTDYEWEVMIPEKMADSIN